MIEPKKCKSDTVVATPGLIHLYQLQMEGLKKGWLIYPESLSPLTLTIKKKKNESAQ